MYSDCLSFHVIHTCILISVDSQTEKVLHTFIVNNTNEFVDPEITNESINLMAVEQHTDYLGTDAQLEYGPEEEKGIIINLVTQIQGFIL